MDKDNFVLVLSQWETMLQCNIVSHWLGTFTKWSMMEFEKRSNFVLGTVPADGLSPLGTALQQQHG